MHVTPDPAFFAVVTPPRPGGRAQLSADEAAGEPAARLTGRRGGGQVEHGDLDGVPAAHQEHAAVRQ